MVNLITLENVKYSLRNLWARKSRSFLTIFSIFIGIATIFIFISFGAGLYFYVEDFTTGGSVDKFMVDGKSFGGPGTSSVVLNDDDVETVSKTRGVFEVSTMTFKPVEVSLGDEKKYVYLSGYDPKTDLLFESFNIDVERGRALESGDANSITVGYNYQLDDLIFSKGIDINDRLDVNGVKFKVVGFYEKQGNPADDSNIYMTYDGFEKLYPGEESYSMIIGRADVDDVDGTVDRVEKALRKARGEEEGQEEFSVTSFSEQLEAFSMVLNMIVAFIIMIAFISVVVSAVNTANTMVTSVLERVQEIGIIKSIGAKNSEIFNIFLFESSVLGFIAGVIGVLIGWAISSSLGNLLDQLSWGFLSPYISWQLFLGCILFATVVGALSGIAPAINASKKKPVDALRYE